MKKPAQFWVKINNGAFLAALAMVRSTIEAVVTEGYKASGKDLAEKINSVRSKLPPSASAEKLHKIRLRANSTLHLNVNKNNSTSADAEILTLDELVTLRHLIEGIGKR